MGVKKVFFDTNILFYAHDEDAGGKHEVAAAAVRSAWNQAVYPVISVQVLQEFLHNLRKKLQDIDKAIAVAEDYTAWPVIANDLSLFRSGTGIMRRYQISLWDAMIVAAANRAGVDELWTEDLNAGQIYGSVLAVNPFAATAAE